MAFFSFHGDLTLCIFCVLLMMLAQKFSSFYRKVQKISNTFNNKNEIEKTAGKTTIKSFNNSQNKLQVRLMMLSLLEFH